MDGGDVLEGVERGLRVTEGSLLGREMGELMQTRKERGAARLRILDDRSYAAMATVSQLNTPLLSC